VKYRDVSRKLITLGCQEIPRTGGGSHRKWKNSKNGRLTVIPDWGSRDLKFGTVRAVVRQLGIDWSEFEAA